MMGRIEASFVRKDDRVLIVFSRPEQVLDMDYETAFTWAKSLIKLGEEAQRVGAGHARMSRREIDSFEESICGTPSLWGS